jgi:hypothetical protein
MPGKVLSRYTKKTQKKIQCTFFLMVGLIKVTNTKRKKEKKKEKV